MATGGLYGSTTNGLLLLNLVLNLLACTVTALLLAELILNGSFFKKPLPNRLPRQVARGTS